MNRHDGVERPVMIGDRWGVSAAEIARTYPCDEIVPKPTMAAWRGVTVRASTTEVWPWVTQLRLAPYSYDWIDNLGRRSPHELRGLPEPVVGENFTAAVGRPLGTVLSVGHGTHYTGVIMGAVMSYVLVPKDENTRLLLKIVSTVPRVVAPLLSAGDLVMARKQLLTLRACAESDRAARGTDAW